VNVAVAASTDENPHYGIEHGRAGTDHYHLRVFIGTSSNCNIRISWSFISFISFFSFFWSPGSLGCRPSLKKDGADTKSEHKEYLTAQRIYLIYHMLVNVESHGVT
jgi:hypothetical protein